MFFLRRLNGAQLVVTRYADAGNPVFEGGESSGAKAQHGPLDDIYQYLEIMERTKRERTAAS